MMNDDTLLRLRSHRNNVSRYRRLLATHLTEIESDYVNRRLKEEQDAIASLLSSGFSIGRIGSGPPRDQSAASP